jgi:hypothetical protein
MPKSKIRKSYEGITKQNKNKFDKTYIYLTYDIQGVSEFDRQTFRADFMIKNKHKTLNTYGVKNA